MRIHVKLELVLDSHQPDSLNITVEEKAQLAFAEYMGDVGVHQVAQGIQVIEVLEDE